MIASSQIREGLPVVGSENGQFAVVDHLEGSDLIKLNKDSKGLHHYIPIDWVTKVDNKVHIDRTRDQAMKEWTDSPKNAKGGFGTGNQKDYSGNKTQKSTGGKSSDMDEMGHA